MLDVHSQSSYACHFAFAKEEIAFRARFMIIRGKWGLFQAKSMIRGPCSSRTRIEVGCSLGRDGWILLVLIISLALPSSCDRKYHGSEYAGAGTATPYTKCFPGIEIYRRARFRR